MNKNEFYQSKYNHDPIVENKAFLEYPIRTLDPPISIVDRAKEIEKADQWIQAGVNQKLDVILKQIRSLQKSCKRNHRKSRRRCKTP
jgi:hypothetical protein